MSPSKTPADKIKAKTFLDFYRMDKYDAVALSSREISLGMKLWLEAKEQGYPLVIGNLFKDKKGKKPAFEQFLVKKDHDYRLGVVGFISPSAWKALPKDSTADLTYVSPYECKKLMKLAAHRSDHLTVIGEFTQAEAESLIHTFPEINMVVTSSNDNNGRSIPVGKSVIVGSQSRGYFGNYVDWHLAKTDTINPFILTTATLDGTNGEDTLMTKLISAANELIKNPNKKP